MGLKITCNKELLMATPIISRIDTVKKSIVNPLVILFRFNGLNF